MIDLMREIACILFVIMLVIAFIRFPLPCSWDGDRARNQRYDEINRLLKSIERKKRKSYLESYGKEIPAEQLAAEMEQLRNPRGR